jgi:predicted O-methyltransferase YrrM
LTYSEVEIFCKKNNLPSISKEQGEFLSFLVKLVQPKVIVEVGTCAGYSTLWLASSDSKVITFEKDLKMIEIAKRNFAKYNKKIEIIEGDALKNLKFLNKVDFVFLDGTKKEYLDYFKELESKIKKGVVVADNTISHIEKLMPYLEYVREKYFSVSIPFLKGFELTLIES